MGALIVVKLIILYAFLDVATATDSCAKEFRARGYIPTYAKGLKRTDLEVKYENTTVKCGDSVSLLLRAVNSPILKIDLPVHKCRNVTVLSFSPDAAVNPPHLTWLVHNIPAVALKKGWTNGGSIIDKLEHHNQGDVKAAYEAQSVPKQDIGAGTNTLIYFVYCQCDYIDDIQPLRRIDRTGLRFDPKSYAAKHGLKCPVAGLFLQATVTGLNLVPNIVKLPPILLPVIPKDIVPPLPIPAVPV